jgi:hypothetical protein
VLALRQASDAWWRPRMLALVGMSLLAGIYLGQVVKL